MRSNSRWRKPRSSLKEYLTPHPNPLPSQGEREKNSVDSAYHSPAMPPPADPHQRFRRSMWAMIAYLLGFALLITFIARYYLIPAMQAAQAATPGQKQQLTAYSMLLMAIVLLIVFVGIVLTFRISRFFFPRPPHQRTQ